MQRNACKINEAHINTIALKARLENNECGYLWKLTSNDSNGKWQVKWFVLYQNFLFYYENVNSTKPSGLILLEGCYCTRNVANSKNTREGEIKLVGFLNFCFFALWWTILNMQFVSFFFLNFCSVLFFNHLFKRWKKSNWIWRWIWTWMCSMDWSN